MSNNVSLLQFLDRCYRQRMLRPKARSLRGLFTGYCAGTMTMILIIVHTHDTFAEQTFERDCLLHVRSSHVQQSISSSI